uniref:Uncharacterized protein n=1 Tax=viral metagenome TaxID=1070528 RepID=A0A6C0JTQ3_9ZZZZ
MDARSLYPTLDRQMEELNKVDSEHVKKALSVVTEERRKLRESIQAEDSDDTFLDYDRECTRQMVLASTNCVYGSTRDEPVVGYDEKAHSDSIMNFFLSADFIVNREKDKEKTDLSLSHDEIEECIDRDYRNLSLSDFLDKYSEELSNPELSSSDEEDIMTLSDDYFSDEAEVDLVEWIDSDDEKEV